jgi:hypothetical protein
MIYSGPIGVAASLVLLAGVPLAAAYWQRRRWGWRALLLGLEGVGREAHELTVALERMQRAFAASESAVIEWRRQALKSRRPPAEALEDAAWDMAIDHDAPLGGTDAR